MGSILSQKEPSDETGTIQRIRTSIQHDGIQRMFLSIIRTMTVIRIVVVVMLVKDLVPLSAQAGQSVGIPSTAVTSLRLTATIAGQRYCVGDGEMNMLHLVMKFDLHNVSNRPVVVYVGSPSIVRVNLARNFDALRAGTFEVEMFPSTMTAGDEEDPRTVRKLMVTITGAEHYEFHDALTVAVPVSAGGVSIPGVTSSPGQHVLRLTVRTWPFDPTQTALFWNPHNRRELLLTQDLVTAPIPIRIDATPKLLKCD